MPDVDVLILAGGRGSRLGGVNKGLLDIGGRTCLERVLQALGVLGPREVVLVTNDDMLTIVAGARVILDPKPHAGVLPALAAGLEASTAEFCLTVAVDMPFLSAPLCRFLLDQADGYDVVIPEVRGYLEPMHAIYRTGACAQAVHSALARGEQRMISFLDAVRVRRVGEAALRGIDPDLLALCNINTQDDLDRARALVEREILG